MTSAHNGGGEGDQKSPNMQTNSVDFAGEVVNESSYMESP